MSTKNYFESGTWNIICDSCGKKIKAKHARHRWDGFIVCDGCFEFRHPQDFIRAKPERNKIPFSRPRPPDIYTAVPYINIYVIEDYIDSGYFEEIVL